MTETLKPKTSDTDNAENSITASSTCCLEFCIELKNVITFAVDVPEVNGEPDYETGGKIVLAQVRQEFIHLLQNCEENRLRFEIINVLG